MTVATLLAHLSGLRLVASDLDPATLVGTSIALHICYAIMCRLIAHNNGYSKTLWTLLGLIGGLWSVAVLILLPRRDGAVPPPLRPLP
jgi:hypothetical protein